MEGELARIANDGLIAACDRYPDRFVALARLPLPDADDGVKEARRVEGVGAIRGVSLLAEAVRYCLIGSTLSRFGCWPPA